jgi:hypothetical protein
MQDKFQSFCVLDDGETFSGVDGSTICFYENDEDMSEDDLELLENGVLPEKPKIVIDLATLLDEAIEMNLKSVHKLLVAMGR